MYVHISIGIHKIQKRASNSLEVMLKAVVSSQCRVLSLLKAVG